VRLATVVAVLLTVGVVLPASASAAGAYQQVLHVYEHEGSIPPCQFTSAQLQSALNGVDTYGAQYFADFTQAIQAALSSRAGGSCSPAAPAAPGGSSGGGASGGPVAPPPAVSLTAATSAGVPLPLALLGGLAVTGVVLGAGLAVMRRRTGD
jgi:hypothetical protein